MIDKNMMLITSKNTLGTKTFSMIPINKQCPYNEAIYDIDNKILVVLSKDKKENLRTVPKNVSNYLSIAYNFNTQITDNYIKQEVDTICIEEYYTYYIEQKEEIINFISKFCINYPEFSIGEYFK